MNNEVIKDLVMRSLKASVKNYPAVLPHLKGTARWHGEVYACKLGEAPDDYIRLRDEAMLTGYLSDYLADLLERLVAEIRKRQGVVPLAFWEKELLDMWDELSGRFVGVLVNGTQGGLILLPPDLRYRINDSIIKQHLIEYARVYRDTWLKFITETTRDFVQKNIIEWLQSGQPLDKLIKNLMDPKHHMFDKIRAEMIAVTEVTRLNAWGNQLVWDQAGYIQRFRWNTAEDELVCKICGRPDGYAGKEYPLADLATMMPAHPRCRCWPTPIVTV